MSGSVGVSRCWCTGVVSCSQGWKWMVRITVLLPDICQAAGDFCFPVHHACARALSCCDTTKTPDFTPDVASQQTRPQFCWLPIIYWQSFSNACVSNSKVRQTSLMSCGYLTVWHFINRMTSYISQGRVETLIRRGGQLRCSSIKNLLQYLCVKIINIQCGLTKLL